MRAVIPLGALLLVSLAAGASLDAAICGRIVDSEGTPVSGAEIRLVHCDGRAGAVLQAVQSGDDGAFCVDGASLQMAVEDPQRWWLDVAAKGYALSRLDDLFTDIGGYSVGDIFVLRPVAVSGTVRDRAGQPVVGVEVFATPGPRGCAGGDAALGDPVATTGADGRFSFASMAPGIATLEFRKAGYVSEQRSATVLKRDGATNRYEIQLREQPPPRQTERPERDPTDQAQERAATPTPAQAIRVVVTSRGGATAAIAWVEFRDPRDQRCIVVRGPRFGPSVDAGSAEVTIVSPTEWLIAWKERPQRDSERGPGNRAAPTKLLVVLADGSRLAHEIADAQTTSGGATITMEAEPSGSIRGVVRFGAGGAGAPVELTLRTGGSFGWPVRRTIPDASGKFEFDRVAPGKQTITITRGAFRGAVEVEVTPGTTSECTIAGVPVVPIRARVLAYGTKPASGALVSLCYDPGQSGRVGSNPMGIAKADADGMVEFLTPIRGPFALVPQRPIGAAQGGYRSFVAEFYRTFDGIWNCRIQEPWTELATLKLNDLSSKAPR